MTDEERKSLDPNSQEYAMRVGGSKTQLVGWSLYTLLLWTLKLSMNIFYERLTYVFFASHSIHVINDLPDMASKIVASASGSL